MNQKQLFCKIFTVVTIEETSVRIMNISIQYVIYVCVDKNSGRVIENKISSFSNPSEQEIQWDSYITAFTLHNNATQ